MSDYMIDAYEKHQDIVPGISKGKLLLLVVQEQAAELGIVLGAGHSDDEFSVACGLVRMMADRARRAQ